MDKEYLLTYLERYHGYNFEWFESESEMLDRKEELIKIDVINDIEAMHIRVLETY